MRYYWQIHISEMMIRYKLNQTEKIEIKIKKIRKNYAEHLSVNQRDNKFISIIEQLIYYNEINSEKLKKEIDNLINTTPDNSATNTDIINYNDWLRLLN